MFFFLTPQIPPSNPYGHCNVNKDLSFLFQRETESFAKERDPGAPRYNEVGGDLTQGEGLSGAAFLLCQDGQSKGQKRKAQSEGRG